MSVVYGSYTEPKNVQSGVAEYVLLAPSKYIKTLGNPVPGTSQIVTKHEFTDDAATAGFIKMALAPNKNSFESKTKGDIGMQRSGVEAKIFIPGSNAEIHSVLRGLINVPLIALVKDATCEEGFYYQLGSACVKAYLSKEFSTGTTSDGNKGYMATISAEHDVLLYKPGEEPVVLQDATI